MLTFNNFWLSSILQEINYFVFENITFLIYSLIYFQIYDASNGQMLYSLMDNDTLSSRLPVTQIRFPPPIENVESKYEHILLACCKSNSLKFLL